MSRLVDVDLLPPSSLDSLPGTAPVGFASHIQIPAPAVLPVVPRGPTVSILPPDEPPTPVVEPPRAAGPRKQKMKHNTTLVDLMNAKLLQAGQTLTFIRSDPPALGTLHDDGTISAHFNGTTYTTIGGFAIAAHRHAGGAGKGIDGWRTVKPVG